jgi:hypothetical protein
MTLELCRAHIPMHIVQSGYTEMTIPQFCVHGKQYCDIPNNHPLSDGATDIGRFGLLLSPHCCNAILYSDLVPTEGFTFQSGDGLDTRLILCLRGMRKG